MKYLLLALVVLTLLPTDAVARRNIWRQKRVVVYDYVGAEWQVEEAVNRFNAMLPRRAPQLMHVPMSGPCQRQKRAITVCVIPDAEMSTPGALALTAPTGNFRRRAYQRVTILFVESAVPGLGLTCHELFHAMGGSAHGAHGSWVYDSSCPYDAEIMNNIYRKENMRDRR